MRIELNGESHELPDGATLADAVARGRRRATAAAASRSRSTARSCRAASGRRRALAEGSKVEVLAAIQGGAEGWELGGRTGARG